MTQTLSITFPREGMTVKGTVVVNVSLVNVKVVNFYVDNVKVGSSSTAPFSYTIDTTKLSDGAHVIKASSGNGHIHSSVNINVLNTVVPPPPPPPPNPYPVPVGSLIFSDEFDGTTLDTHKWDHKGFKAPSGTQWNKGANTTLDGNSNLVITAKKVNGAWFSDFIAGWADNGFSYSGARYVEARAKIPGGTGVFPAPIWEWASKWGAGPIEIDVCEQLGDGEPHGYHTTFHTWESTGDQSISLYNDVGVNLSEDFHTYGAAIYAHKIDYYFDGKLIRTMSSLPSSIGDITKWAVVPCIDLDMGGWAKTVDPNLTSATMLVDYFRVYNLA